MTDDDRRYTRAFATTLEAAEPTADGRRQLTARLVPYNVDTVVVDEFNGQQDVYREGFRSGAFDPQVSARGQGIVNKIGLVHRHEGGLGYLGPFIGLRDEPDGLYGDVAVLRTKTTDVEDLLDAGVRQLSIEFRLPGGARADNTVLVNGVRWRTRAHLDQVALEPRGAYHDAEVLAFRSEQDELDAAARAEEERLAEEAAAAEVAAAEAEERKKRWDAMSDRLDGELDAQRKLVEQYGVTQVSGWQRVDR